MKFNDVPFFAAQVQELQSLDNQVRDQIALAIQHAEKLIAQRLTKAQYVDSETTVKGKRDKIYQKMEDLLMVL